MQSVEQLKVNLFKKSTVLQLILHPNLQPEVYAGL